VTITPDSPEEVEIVHQLLMDWMLYGELHVTNAPQGHGLTRLDPTGITYTPPEEAKS
jgi:hypothetical protein